MSNTTLFRSKTLLGNQLNPDTEIEKVMKQSSFPNELNVTRSISDTLMKK